MYSRKDTEKIVELRKIENAIDEINAKIEEIENLKQKKLTMIEMHHFLQLVDDVNEQIATLPEDDEIFLEFEEYFQDRENYGARSFNDNNNKIVDIDDLLNEITDSQLAYQTLKGEIDEFQLSLPSFKENSEHTAIVNMVIALGYKFEREGMCQGIAYMGMQAMISGDKKLEEFNNRVTFMQNIALQTQQEAQEDVELRERAMAVVNQAMIEAENGLSEEDQNNIYLVEIYKDYLNRELSSWTQAAEQAEGFTNLFELVSEEEKAYWELLKSVDVFAQDVSLYFDPSAYAADPEYSSMFTDPTKVKIQEADKVLGLLQPVGLDKAGFDVVKVGEEACQSCRYFENHEKLEKYLSNFMNDLKGKVHTTVGFAIYDGAHAISIGFDPDKQEYLLIDANNLPVKRYKDSKHFALVLASVMQIDEKNQVQPKDISPIIFHFTAYAATNDPVVKQSIKQAFDQPLEIPAMALDSSGEQYRYKQSNLSWLDLAVIKNDVPVVTQLLQAGYDPNIRDEEGSTPIHYAAQRGHVEMVDVMLTMNADPNVADFGGHTIMHIAVNFGQAELVERLSSLRDENTNLPILNINQQNLDGTTPLHVAVNTNRPELAKVLLKSGADINMMDNEGNTALLLAAKTGNIPMIKLLIAKGANMEVGNQSAITEAENAGKLDAVQALKQCAQQYQSRQAHKQSVTKEYKEEVFSHHAVKTQKQKEVPSNQLKGEPVNSPSFRKG